MFTVVERLTGCYLSIRIDSKTTAGVSAAMEQLKAQYGDKFSQAFRSITTDNGNKFAAFSAFDALGTEIYFAHEQILMFADEINATPRKRLGYRMPEELFEKYLDRIYTTNR